MVVRFVMLVWCVVIVSVFKILMNDGWAASQKTKQRDDDLLRTDLSCFALFSWKFVVGWCLPLVAVSLTEKIKGLGFLCLHPID